MVYAQGRCRPAALRGVRSRQALLIGISAAWATGLQPLAGGRLNRSEP